MRERLLLVSTCGTSLFTNGAPPDDKSWITEVANEREVDSGRLNAMIQNRRDLLLKGDEATRRKMSAELNGVSAALARYTPREVSHFLVHTDTAVGAATAALVKEALGANTQLVSAGGLRTNHLASFRAALADLTHALDGIVNGYKTSGWFVVFNLTGGFKSLNGYLQTFAMIMADRCVFQFESSPELMEIPRLPVQLADRDELRRNLRVFRQLAVDYAVKTHAVSDAPETLFMDVGDDATTSILGDLAWGRHRDALFAEELHEPLSSKIRLSNAVQKEFARLEAKHKVQVNEALDELSAHLDHNRPLVKSRTFKKLQGNPVPGSTHELYAWSDGATGRLFAHETEGGVFVFDSLRDHL